MGPYNPSTTRSQLEWRKGPQAPQRVRAVLIEDRVCEVGFEGRQELGWLCECVGVVQILGDSMLQMKSMHTEVESFKGVDPLRKCKKLGTE